MVEAQSWRWSESSEGSSASSEERGRLKPVMTASRGATQGGGLALNAASSCGALPFAASKSRTHGESPRRARTTPFRSRPSPPPWSAHVPEIFAQMNDPANGLEPHHTCAGAEHKPFKRLIMKEGTRA